MGILNRILSSSRQQDITKIIIPECTGSITAGGAWAVVAPLAERHDPHARLRLITSGTDISHEGRSRTWEFIFLLPSHNATVMLCLESDPHSEDIDRAPCVLTQHISPASSLDIKGPFLPKIFRDSPEVVAEFIARGVDYVAGPTDMKLEGRVLSSGEATWITYYWDKEFATPFTARSS